MSFLQFLSLIHLQAVMKLKSQANALVLSYLWWILEPLLYVFLFYFVFKYVLYRGGDNFLMFLLVGKIPFLWFSKAVTSGANSIIQNKGIVMQKKVTKIIFPLTNCQEAFYKQIFAFAVLIIYVFLAGFGKNIDWIQFIILVLIQYFLIVGVATFFSIFVTAAIDFNMLIQMFMMGLMFTSGIFWDVNLIQDPQMKNLLMTLNPLATLIDGYRQVLMYGGQLNVNYIGVAAIWAIVSVLIGGVGLSIFSNRLTRRLFA